MGSESELIRLEKYIERLLKGYTALKAEKQQVEQNLQKQKTETDKLQKELNSLDSERGSIRDRVNSLIGQIEQWESEVGEESGEGDSDDDSEEEDPEEEDPEEEDPEEDDLPEPEEMSEEERGGGVQKKLFSG